MSGPAIPYERQADARTNRMCGAACLAMVYGSFGQPVAQAEIWPTIAKDNRSGSLASTTHLMARDAARRGFDALAMQARHPLQALAICRDSGIRAIVNLRLAPDVPTGHYAVLVDIDDTKVVLHDPYLGPSRRLSHAELLELWHPRGPASEIAGQVLIGVAAGPAADPGCTRCRSPIPSRVLCPRCTNPVGLRPGALLGCMDSGCGERMWNYVCCPSCDYLWTFIVPASPAGVAAPGSVPRPPAAASAAAPRPEDPLDLDGMFRELDKFCNHVLSLPGAASHPDIKAQIDFLMANKEKLRFAQAEALAHGRRHKEQMAAVLQAAKLQEEAHRRRVEELGRPAPPLDGDALGRALLKQLGWAKQVVGEDR